MKKNILVIGSGGREHAIIKSIKRSPRLNKLYALPGNAGINQDAIGVLDIKVSEFQKVAEFCKSNAIDFVIVGPEQPLVDGIADYLESKGVKVFGPDKRAAQLEGSKDFMKYIVTKYNVPTAEYRSFDSADLAKEYINKKGAPIVIKTDGLAAGKGVTVATNVDEALKAVDEAFGGKFGAAGNKVVIEEFMAGEEASFFVVTDGKTALEFGYAQDHKRVADGDKGPNTGGMGTYSPAPVVTDSVREKVMERIINPTLHGLQAENIDYTGFLFAGLMIDKFGNPKLIEYNIRMGDPETQVIFPRLKTDFIDVVEACCNKNLSDLGKIEFSKESALCVVMAAKGYPEDYKKGSVIDLSKVENDVSTLVFHAGTALDSFGNLVSNGGRVLGITGIGKTIREAQENAYIAVKKVKFEEGFCRSDIGWRALAS